MKKKKTTKQFQIGYCKSTSNEAKLVIAIIQSKIVNNLKNIDRFLDSSDKFTLSPNQVHVHSDEWRLFLGRDYKKILQETIDNGDVIRYINTQGTQSYSTGQKKGKHNNPKEGATAFSKAYMLSDSLYHDIKNKRFQTVRLFVNATRGSIKRKKEVKTKDKYLNIENNLKQLQISSSVYDSESYDYFDPRDDSYINSFKDSVFKITDGDPDHPEEEKMGRIYHPAINMKKGLRKFLSHSSGERLVEIDAANMFPTLMATLIKDVNEKHRWLKLCMGGQFYTDLVGVDPSEKNEWKPRFMIAITDKNVPGDKVKIIRDVIRTQFPSLYKAIHAIFDIDKTLVSTLGRIETKLLRDPFMKETKFWLPYHDGILVLESDMKYFMNKIQSVAAKVLKYPLKFTTKTVLGEEVVFHNTMSEISVKEKSPKTKTKTDDTLELDPELADYFQ